MIRLIILICVFLAVYPYIGTGYDQFVNDFNLSAVSEVIGNIFDSVLGIVERLKE